MLAYTAAGVSQPMGGQVLVMGLNHTFKSLGEPIRPFSALRASPDDLSNTFWSSHNLKSQRNIIHGKYKARAAQIGVNARNCLLAKAQKTTLAT